MAASCQGPWVLACLLLAHTVQAAPCFSSLFAFGDGQFDTGSISAVFPSVLNYDFPPYGETFFKKPSGRFSDGRLVLDFLAEAIGLPRISSYLQTVVSDYSAGVNFASAFSTISTVSTGATAGPFLFLSPFALSVQLLQFLEFKSTTGALIAKVHNSTSASQTSTLAVDEEPATSTTPLNTSLPLERLPTNADFSSGLFVVSTGAHDIVNLYNLNNSGVTIQNKFDALLTTYGLFVRTLARLYGVKNIIVFDIEPLGCQPFLLTLTPHTGADVDAKGCIIATNFLVQKFNAKLKTAVQSWRALYNANIVFLSQYDIKIDLMKDASSGFNTTNVACCGFPSSPYNVAPGVPCGPAVVDPTTNTTLMASACSNPSSYMYWDGFYTTEAANKYVTEKILSGAYFDVPFEALTSCATNPLS